MKKYRDNRSRPKLSRLRTLVGLRNQSTNRDAPIARRTTAMRTSTWSLMNPSALPMSSSSGKPDAELLREEVDCLRMTQLADDVLVGE